MEKEENITQQEWVMAWQDFASADKATEVLRELCQAIQDVQSMQKKKSQWWRTENEKK